MIGQEKKIDYVFNKIRIKKIVIFGSLEFGGYQIIGDCK